MGTGQWASGAMAERAEGPEAEAAEAASPSFRRRPGGPPPWPSPPGAAAGTGPDAALDAFLREQADLIRIQKEHLHEQRELVLSRLRWGRFSDRVKAALQVMTAPGRPGGRGGDRRHGLAGARGPRPGHRRLLRPARPRPGRPDRPGSPPPASLTSCRRCRPPRPRPTVRRSPTTTTGAPTSRSTSPRPASPSASSRSCCATSSATSTTSPARCCGRRPASPSPPALGDTPAQTFTGPESDFDALAQQAAEQVYRASQPYRFNRIPRRPWPRGRGLRGHLRPGGQRAARRAGAGPIPNGR